MKYKRLSIILSLLMVFTLTTTTFAVTPTENLQNAINQAEQALSTGQNAIQLVEAIKNLSKAILRFQNPTEIIELETPTELRVNDTNNILSWNVVQNATSYEIILRNTNDNTEQKITSNINTYDITSLIISNTEYLIKVKALAGDGYADSEYSIGITYTKQDPTELQAPVITSLALENIVSKKVESYEDDYLFKIALNLKWDYTGNDAFVVKIQNGTEITNVEVGSTQRELRLNKYITKPDTKYTIDMIAKNGSNESIPSNSKSYNTDSGCGHTDGFIFSADYNINSGTKAYAVSTPEQFEHINLHTVVGPFSSDTFIQMNDIDFNNKDYNNNIIEQMVNRYDGQGFMVDNFKIEGTEFGDPHIGVFGDLTNNTLIKDFGVGPNVTITARAGYVGSVVGYGYCRIYRCYNFGTIKAYNVKGAGGITGRAMFGLQDCYNGGTIIGEGSSAVGGLVGIYDSKTVSIWNSYNAGNVTGKNQAGGLVGASLEANQLTIGNSYNTGKIIGADGRTGAIIGEGQPKVLKDTYYLDSSSVSGIGSTSKPDEYMKSQTFVSDLNKNTHTKFNKLPNYSYPQLNTNPHRIFK